MTNQPYEYVQEHTNGFDLQLAEIGETRQYRVKLDAFDGLAFSVKIWTLTWNEELNSPVWDFDKVIPESDLAIIRKIAFNSFKVQF